MSAYSLYRVYTQWQFIRLPEDVLATSAWHIFCSPRTHDSTAEIFTFAGIYAAKQYILDVCKRRCPATPVPAHELLLEDVATLLLSKEGDAPRIICKPCAAKLCDNGRAEIGYGLFKDGMCINAFDIDAKLF